MEKLLFSCEDASLVLALGRTKIYQLIAEGRIESITVDRRRLIPRQAIEDFVRRQREAQAVGS
jgi:excisionase family DNA binding protein